MKNKKVLALVMAAAMTFGGTYSAYAMEDDKYTDVASTADYFASIEKMVDLNVMQGKTDTEFGINEAVSRADLVSYMYKLIKSPKANGSLVYADVAGTEFEDAVIWAESNKLFVGMADSFFDEGNFDSTDGITRAEACMMLMNYAKNVLKIDTSKNVADSLSNYEDAGDILAVYDTAVKWAVGNDLINEREDVAGKVLPNEEISKKETAEFLYKLLNMVTDESVELLKLEEEKDVLNLAGNTNLVTPDWTGNTGNNDNTSEDKEDGDSVNKAHKHTWVEKVTEGKFKEKEVMVKPAWVEKIEHKEQGHYEEVVDQEAWTEEIPLVAEQGHSERVEVVDKEAWTEEIEHPAETHEEWKVDKEAWTETINHPEEGHYENGKLLEEEQGHYETVVDKEAWTEDKWVVDKEAWTETINHPEEGHYETVVDKPAWTEDVVKYKIVCYCGAEFGDSSQWESHMKSFGSEGFLEHSGYKNIPYTETVQHPAETHEEWVVDKEAWTETINHPEEGHMEHIEHPAETHEEWVVDKEAVYEQKWVVDKEAWAEKVEHPEEGHYETVVDKEAWTEKVEHPAKTHWEWQWVVDVPGKTEIIEHPAKTHKEWVVDKEAWTEEKKHPAEYKTIVITIKPTVIKTVCSECGKVKSRVEIVPKDYLKKKA